MLFLGILGALVMRGVMISVGEYAPRLHRSRDVYRTGLIHMNGRVLIRGWEVFIAGSDCAESREQSELESVYVCDELAQTIRGSIGV